MNQQISFNNDFSFDATQQAVVFSCLVSGLKVHCFIKRPATLSAEMFLAQVKLDAFSWEDRAEAAIAADELNSDGEIWL